MEFKDYLKLMVVKEATDLYLTAGAPPSAKIQGALTPIENTPLSNSEIDQIANAIMSEEQKAEFHRKPEMNLAISETGVGRFRVNIFLQRNSCSMVIRHIKTDIPAWDNLGLPEILTDVVMKPRGLVLFAGATGSGKSSSLAALIDHRNSNSAGHIITIEDPIEFIHSHKRSIINQREVGLDTDCYGDALMNTLRQAPDVVMIGEIRDREAMDYALAFCETGHLAISTLRANNVNEALERIINLYPEDRRDQLLMDLSFNLNAIVSQRLVSTIDNRRTAAAEILIGTPQVRELIGRGEIRPLKEAMESSENYGMQTVDMALFKLFQGGLISEDEALRNAEAPNNLRLKISSSTDQPKTGDDKGMNLSLVDDEVPGVGRRGGGQIS